jgi:hypothetical protein
MSQSFKRSGSAAPELISAPNQYQSTMALSTGVAHPCDMDGRQVPFSFAIPPGLEGLTGVWNSRAIRRRQARWVRQEIYESYTFTCVCSR